MAWEHRRFIDTVSKQSSCLSCGFWRPGCKKSESVSRPASNFSQGLAVGDTLISVDGLELDDLALPSVLQLLEGEVGSKAIIGVRRKGSGIVQLLSVSRELISSSPEVSLEQERSMNTDGFDVTNSSFLFQDQTIFSPIASETQSEYFPELEITLLDLPSGQKIVESSLAKGLAGRSGIAQGDTLLQINKVSLSELSLNKIHRLIRDSARNVLEVPLDVSIFGLIFAGTRVQTRTESSHHCRNRHSKQVRL